MKDKIKGFVLGIVVSSMAIGSVTFAPISIVTASPTFSDISGHWAEGVIEKYSNENIISGYPDGSFKPDNPVKRAELAKIITLAFELTEENSFDYSDIDTKDWFYDYLKYVSPYVPTYQYEGNIFAGNSNAYRVDVAETLVEIKRHKENLGIDVPFLEKVAEDVKNNFKDADYQYGDIKYPNVQRLFLYTWLSNSMGIIQGDADGYFRPAWGVTRAELLTIIDRVEKSEPLTDEEVKKAFEENYFKSDTISLITMADGSKSPHISETLDEYKINSVVSVGPNIWAVSFDVKPKHSPDADVDPSKSSYMYGWMAGNGTLDDDWVRDKSLFVQLIEIDGVVNFNVIGTGL